ncbi:MAG: carbamoyl phosphate synthase large subunit [Planctomycetes bacterium]|nr:carbamoyl phosphate synthase large subunit [Planctomycetota bacterium]
MPKREDLSSILVLGSGPIVIGQACEFDYSGTQGVKALKEEGYRVILVNSNPATIMTDPEMAHATYVEPITAEIVEKVIVKERPDALLPTLGGQTALNVAIELSESGVLEKHGVQMIGATAEVIKRAEDRSRFKQTMIDCGLEVPRSGLAYTIEEARLIREKIGLPCVIRPAFTLGGSGGGIAYNQEEFEQIAARGIDLSPVSEILIEESVIGWKEFELEVMRDRNDNVVIICSIENVDPMGVHTGDSITVAPAQTLTDREYQAIRDASITVIRAIGVETGGSNIQFAVDPGTGRLVVIEMNPRVSRSSALASKATGFPIAKIAAKLAIGYTLDELSNDITRKTTACFEPSIDYCVVKVPKWAFQKFPDADSTLTTQMKSVGEVMAIGRTFKESLQKAFRGLEVGRDGFGLHAADPVLLGERVDAATLRQSLSTPNENRLFDLRVALHQGMPVEEINQITGIDPWFLANFEQLVEMDLELIKAGSLDAIDEPFLRELKRYGYSDGQISRVCGVEESAVRSRRRDLRVLPTYKLVDTCAAEFEAYTPYFYSTYEEEDEVQPTDRKKIMILGSGPNRIGQGIEFDYCCVHASYALKEAGFETIMVNSNPETVSTDYDTSDRLYFEPLTHEDVLNIWEKEQPFGCIVQFGGQTPLNLAKSLEDDGVRIIGTSPESIDLAEDRERFTKIVESLDLRQPENGIAFEPDHAREIAHRIGYPVLVRPSYVLGGRAMEVVYDDASLHHYMTHAVEASPARPVLVDRYLEYAIEVDVDVVADGTDSVVGGIMEHIEEAGIHSGDSCCVLPPHTLSDAIQDRIREASHSLAKALDVRGLMNVQFAVKGAEIYIIEVNPRASRTVPFVSKAIGRPLAKIAARVMAEETLKDLGFTSEIIPTHFAVKHPVFPFHKFPGCDIILGPEMRSTGESMGLDKSIGAAFWKAHVAAGNDLPQEGMVFVSVKDADKRHIVPLAQRIDMLGLGIVATSGTWKILERNGIPAVRVKKIAEGRPNITDYMKNREIRLVINTPSGKGPRTDEARIRGLAVAQGIPCITTLAGAATTIASIEAAARGGIEVHALQSYHE